MFKIFKKTFYIFCATFLIFSLVACSSQEETKTADSEFIKTIGTGLEERSNILNKDDTTETLGKAIDKEITLLKPFADKEFQSPELKKLYEDYMTQLDIQKKYYINFHDFTEKLDMNSLENYNRFMKAYDERSKIITTLIDKFGLKLNKELADEFKNNSVKVTNDENINEKLIECFKKAGFKREESYYLRANVKNETGEVITNKIVTAKLIDKENVTIETVDYYVDSDWQADETRAVEFYLTKDKDFDKIEFSVRNL